MKLISPNGKVSVIAHPSQVESMKKKGWKEEAVHSQDKDKSCLLYTSPSPRDRTRSRMPSSA